MSTQFRSAFTINRTAAGTMVKGKFVNSGAVTPVSILASVQPLQGKDVNLLPEGRKTSQAVWIYTDTQLIPLTATTNPDILLAFGSEFEVLTVEPWQSNVIPHYKCIGVKK